MKQLFDHLKQITEVQDIRYWDKLSTTEKKQWSNFMIHRFLSMHMDWTTFTNYVQQYNLNPQEVYRLYIDALPRGKQWLRYIKGKKKDKYPEWLTNIVKKHYEISKLEAIDYLELFFLTPNNTIELKELCKAYAVEPKLIKSVFKTKIGKK